MARLTNAIPSDSGDAEERRRNLLRWARVINVGERYIRNIAQSRQFTNDFERGGVKAARGREYSQNTYMGINAG